MSDPRCQTCRTLLGNALDLCVRARKMDDMDRLNATRSGTIMLWVQEQYERDLADWESSAREHLAAAGITSNDGEGE